MNQALDQNSESEDQPEDPTKVFMGIWRSLAAMDHFPAHSPVWETVRDEVFDGEDERVEKEGNTFLMFALWSNKIEVAKGLYCLGCDPSRPNARGLNVIQSLIRDVSTHKASRTPYYIADILDQMPCQWTAIDPDGKLFDSHSIKHTAGWTKNFLLLDVSNLNLNPSSITKIMDFIAGPLDYKRLKMLTDEVQKGTNPTDGFMINQPEWKAQLAKKASSALMEIVPKHIKDQMSAQNSSPAQPKL